MRFGPPLAILVIVSCSIASADVTFTMNASSTSSISPYIYGINGTINSGGFNNLTFTRAGGNRFTAYNWTNNYSNAGADWYYENDNALSSSTTPAAAVAGTITNGMSNNAATLLTIPMAGYVSKDASGQNWDVRTTAPGSNVLDPNWLSDRMMPSQAAKPGGPASFSTNAGTLHAQTTVYQDEFVNYLKVNYPSAFTANSATPIWFDLDNEPDIWTGTHPEVRPIVAGSNTGSNTLGTPTPLTYTELLNDTVTYATAVKAVAPNTLIFGPVSYGWNGFTTLQNAPDSGAKGDFLTYYLNQSSSASQTAGKRLVDVLDLHWYPEATGAGIRITNNDAGYTGGTLAQLQAARVEAPRSLWDTTYTETSWITQYSTNGPIYLLPRELSKMTSAANTYGAAYAPNKISISEYNYGGGDDISGGIAEADVLGVFGSKGVFSAALWPLSGNEQYAAGGMAMFRNYDGKGGTFGDTSVAVTNPDPTDASLYAADYSTNSGRMSLMAINKSTSNLTLHLPLPNAPNGHAFAQAAVYELTAASATPQFVENIVIANPATFSYTMPGYSVTTFALTTGTASVWAAAVSGSWSSAGNWIGGVPNAVGAVAAINAATTAALTITLDNSQTVGLLQFGNSASAAVGYNISGTGTNSLTVNNGGSGATIAMTDGAHAINAPVVLADNLQVTGNNSGWTLSFGAGSTISGSNGLTMGGNGTLILSGQNTYTGVTTLTSGILNVGSPENAGTSGPLGKSAAANPGSIVFGGGTLQYSASNTNDYSGRFSTAANQPYSVDTNGQNVTWATALTSSGGSLAKFGNGMLTLAAADNFTAANVSGGGIAVSGGTIGAFNLNSGAGTSSIGAGTAVSTMNVSSGGVAVSGGTIGALSLNTGAGTSTISAGAVTTINVSGGGVSLSGGTIAVCNFNTGAGTSTIGAGASVALTNVNAGVVNFNSTRPSGNLALPAASTGTVIVGSSSGGLLPTVATADFSATPATGTVNAANPLAITGSLKLTAGVIATISSGNSFTATGANLASTTNPSTLSLGGGTLTFPTGSTSQSVAVHWSGYGGANFTNVTGADGVVSNSHWNNVGTNWYSGNASSLLNGSGGTTTAAVNCQGPSGAGTYWQVYGSGNAIANGGKVDNVVVGPGGGNGDIASAITGIPYSNYEIIAYANDTNGGANMNMWLDGNPASSGSANAPRAGTNVYFSATVASSTGYLTSFVPITNTTAGTYPAGNYTVWTGLSGSSQTIWLQNDGGDGNIGITGFEIVSTAGPASVNLPATAISATSSTTLDFGETGTPSHYQTLGGLSLTASIAGNTRLQLQDGQNISFHGISAIYPAGGAGPATTSIVGGSTSPVISLAASSSVYVDPNVTLSVGLTVGNPQTGTTTLTKSGGGTLVLSGTNTYSGGTDVQSGILIVTNAAGLESGTSLTVGTSADSIFAAPVPSEVVGSAATTLVPEPGALALIGAAVSAAAIYRSLRSRRREQ
jgi:autotransporter-associated beta strand protein